MIDGYVKYKKDEAAYIQFNYHARGFYCPSCLTGVSLDSKECKYCGQKLISPYFGGSDYKNE